MDVTYNGLDNNDYVNGLGFCCNLNATSSDVSSAKSAAKSATNDNAELQQFYYHPDHLGSSSYISNLDGEVVQHLEYLPFGEVFLEEKNSKWNTPYLFTSKELDRESGMYYFGARYYTPKENVWLTVDPLAEKFPSWSPYNYTLNNPVNMVDPDGRGSKWHPDANGNLVADAGDSTKSLAEYQGISHDQAAKQLADNGYTVNDKGILNLNVGDAVNTGSFNLESVVISNNYSSSSENDTPRMNISTNGLSFLMDREGVRLSPYNDSKGFATIGIGHLIGKRGVTAQDRIDWAWMNTREHAMGLLKKDLSNTYEPAIRSLVQVKLVQYQYDAIVSFTFNVGVGGLQKSNFLRELNKGNYDGDLMLRYKRPAEILGRRQKEVKLFNKGIY